MKNKKNVTNEVTTTIESEVVFMVDPTVDFVSLVKYGANRAPFKILKSDKGGDKMSKVLQAILIKNDLPDEVIEKALEGMEVENIKEYKSYKSYIQVPLDEFEEDSIEVAKSDDGVFSLIGKLSKEDDEAGKIVIDTKEAIDYATLDSLYTELYAMADIVSGAMRQENAEAGFRADTILKAIDNFRSFAEVVLENISNAKAVKLEDHPNLVHPLVKAEMAEPEPEVDAVIEEEQEGELEDATEVDVEKDTEDIEDAEERAKELREGLESISEGIESLQATLDSIGKRVEKIEENDEEREKIVEKLQEDLKAVKSTVKSYKSSTDETPSTEKDEDEKENFKGVFFRPLKMQKS